MNAFPFTPFRFLCNCGFNTYCTMGITKRGVVLTRSLSVKRPDQTPMKLHFVQRSKETRQIEPQSTPLKKLRPLLQPLENSDYPCIAHLTVCNNVHILVALH